MPTMNTNNKTTFQNGVSDIQRVDLTKGGVELSQQQTAYEAALSATAKISSLSLLDYL
jgi:flagellar hook-associated protein 3 FlgL